jgi:hypothetical protein
VSKQLRIDKEIFGLTLFGDGATVHKMPFINMLGSGVHLPGGVLEIVDCMSHLEAGGKKDAVYIASKFTPHLEKLDENKDSVDIIYFDGASNVQKAGQVICARYPRATCLHGSEHVVSLFFSDIAKLPVVKAFITLYRKAYSWFGSGARHAPYAIFSKHCKKFNGGRGIRLIRAADTRMAGHFIAFLRFLRLKEAMLSTLSSAEFLQLDGLDKPLMRILKNDTLYKMMAVLCRAVFPQLRILRLADSKVAGMDKLLFYVRKADVMLQDNMTDLDGIEKEQLYEDMVADVSFFKEDEEELQQEMVHDEFAEQEDRDNDDSDSNESATDPDPPPSSDDSTLYEQIRAAWKKRRQPLIHDYSIVAWMLSPCADVQEDAKNYNHEDIKVVERFITRVIAPLMPTETESERLCSDLFVKFWREYRHFKTRTGVFGDRPYIWTHDYLQRNESHLWHEENSLKSTEVLGKVACRATSKILGVGSAERAWGDVKHIKKDKRAHLSGEKTNMAATLYGANCIEIAEAKRKAKADDPTFIPLQVWDEDDFASIGLSKFGVDINEVTGLKKRVRVFRAWCEDWEYEMIAKKDPVHEARLVEKYGGLTWFDVDNEVFVTSDDNSMYWVSRRGDKGYCVKALGPNYSEDILNDDAVEPWAMTSDLYNSIIEHYKKNPDASINIVEKRDDDEEDSDTVLE